MKMNNEVSTFAKRFGTAIGAILTLWVINLVTLVRTVVNDDFVWSEIGTFTIVQIAGVVVWPISIVTGPISLVFI